MKKFFLWTLILFVLIQFIRPAKNSSSAQSANDITLHYSVPDSVLTVLKRSCYDCHSNNTVYPWYDRVQPIAWWLQYHINHGKGALNFSEFAAYAPAKQAKKLKGIGEEIKQDGMPLDSYLWIHKYARLTAAEKAMVMRWAGGLAASYKLQATSFEPRAARQP
jgi:Haem-binding domain